MNPLDLTILISIKIDFKNCESVFGKYLKIYIFIYNIVDYTAESQVYVGTSLQGPT